MEMQKWEYAIRQFDENAYGKEELDVVIYDEMNRLGQEGWELISTTIRIREAKAYKGEIRSILCFLKRPL